jgi:hypothetical protein
MQNRQKLAASLVKNDFNSVLDIGCGEKVLKEYLPKNIKYQGIDFKENDEVLKYDLEKGIPFGDKSFDAVFAIEVLEHLENIHFVFSGMIRVAKKDIVIALPNMLHWNHRINYFLGRIPLPRHQRFYLEKHSDRHRWIPFHNSSIEFVRVNAKNYKFEVGYGIYPYKKLKFLGWADTCLAKFFPNLFVYTSFFHIDLII